MVNNDPTFAFHVNLKRFSDCGHWYPEAEQFSGNSGGWASSIVVQDIVEKNQDVIAVVADQYSTTAVGPAEALSLNQIPYCSSASSAPTFSDKIKNPYFWRPLPGAGMGEHVFRLLQSWKVGRIALIVQSDDALGASTAADIIRAMKNHGVQVVATVNLPTNLNKFSYLYAKASLEQAQARYIFVCGQGSFSASLLYRMGKLGFWGPKFVWMLYNSPKPYYGDPLQTYGPDYYNYVQGSIVLLPTTVPSTVPYVQTFQNTIKKMGGAYFYYSYGTGASYDCVMMMMLGLNQLLQRNPSWTPQMLATRQLQSHMNYTIFKNVSYNGISAMPATLSDSGDLLVGYTASFYTGNYLNLTSFGQTSQDGSQFIPSTTITPVFAANTTLIPVDGPPPLPVIVDTMDTSNGKVMLALSVSGLVICAAVLVFVGVFRGSRVVKSASPPDLVVVVLGCVSVYVSILFYIGESTDSTCTARIVTLVMGVGAILTSLLVKNLMLVVLFRFKAAMGKAEAARLRMGTLILKFLLIGIEALIAGIWVKQSGVQGVQDVGSNRVVYECQDWVGRGKQISHFSVALYVFNGILLLCIAPIIYGLRLVSWGNMNESSTLTMIAVFWAVFFLSFKLLHPLLQTRAPVLKQAFVFGLSQRQLWVFCLEAKCWKFGLIFRLTSRN
ncbi:periplasmic binding protein-like I [Rhizoclosmatium globosum]|uniref:Periplasmic binding protein-like I n=1 Tax=Rhizoclosmatium globosum TaxID=329046 RepID=A0A1Y2CWE6_9FUNG|nr:periplasmic binding protein-like I [Rhizoclosmatium globosum]|eukprot:ORY51307.1 periplasmic binding protein-like I [Rhizoclosmatium globosum]